MIFQKVKYELSAMPVMMPGQRDRQHEQERDRLAAEEAEAVDAERRRRAEHERDRASRARRPCSESQSACCMSPLWIAGENHFVVSPGIGQLCTFDVLNA